MGQTPRKSTYARDGRPASARREKPPDPGAPPSHRGGWRRPATARVSYPPLNRRVDARVLITHDSGIAARAPRLMRMRDGRLGVEDDPAFAAVAEPSR